MKLTGLILSLILLLSTPALATNWCENANIRGCWTAEDIDGGVVSDDSAQANDFTISGSVTLLTASPPAAYSTSYLDFAGTDDYLTQGDSDDWDFTGDLTLLSWVNPDVADAETRFLYRYDSTTTDGFTIGQGSAGSGIYQIAVWEGGTVDTAVSNGVPVAGTWAHVAGVRDSGTLRLYVDGVLQTDTGTEAGTINGTASLTYGIDVFGGSDFNGQGDEFAMFGTLLSITDINDIMDNGLVQAAAGRTRRFF